MTAPIHRAQLHIAIDPKLMRNLDEWIKQQEFPPSKTAVVEAALSAFLESKADKRKRVGG